MQAVNATIEATESLAQQRLTELAAAEEAERVRLAAEENDRAERAAAAAKRQKEAADRAEAERKAKADAEQAAKQEQAAVAAVAARAPSPDSPEAFWLEHMSRIQRIKADVLPAVSDNPEWSRACREARRTMTTKVGQVTNSTAQIRQVVRGIVKSADSQTSALAETLSRLRAVDEICYRWGLNHLSKCLIKQAETELVSRSSAAFPLGRVVVGLLLGGHGPLGDVLFARLVKKCFWLTGWFPQRAPGMDEAAHQKLLGHAPPTSGESSTQYTDRMAGIVSLWAAIVQTHPNEPPQRDAAAHEGAHHDIPVSLRPATGWRWIGSVLNGPLAALDPAPRLINAFMSIAGPVMASTYKKQLHKAAKLVADNLDRFSPKAKPSVVRLQLQLEDFAKDGYQPIVGRFLDD